jgi:hypothetical protein
MEHSHQHPHANTYTALVAAFIRKRIFLCCFNPSARRHTLLRSFFAPRIHRIPKIAGSVPASRLCSRTLRSRKPIKRRGCVCVYFWPIFITIAFAPLFFISVRPLLVLATCETTMCRLFGLVHLPTVIDENKSYNLLSGLFD